MIRPEFMLLGQVITTNHIRGTSLPSRFRLRTHDYKCQVALCVHNIPLAVEVRGIWFGLDQIIGQQYL
jgi:hypothetical protein